MKGEADPRREFLDALGRPFLGEELFDHVADIVVFVKDRDARYVAVNDTLVKRCDLAAKADLVGRTARDLFPPPLGESFENQDRSVLRDGISIRGRLELHLYPRRRQGWCLTWKAPLYNRVGNVVGLTGISRDVPNRAARQIQMTGLSSTLGYIHEHLDSELRIPDLAKRAGLSVFQFDQRVRTFFGLSAGQYLTRARIDLACDRLLETDAAISIVAQDCGYSDQAAFTRQFRKSVGLTPGAYRGAAKAGAR